MTDFEEAELRRRGYMALWEAPINQYGYMRQFVRRYKVHFKHLSTREKQ